MKQIAKTNTAAVAKTWKYKVVALDAEGNKVAKPYKVYATPATSETYSNASKVIVDKTEATLKLGKSLRIVATIELVDPDKRSINGKSAKNVSFYSTNEAVATVSSKGKIKAVGAGKCEIYAVAANGEFAVVTVTVK